MLGCNDQTQHSAARHGDFPVSLDLSAAPRNVIRLDPISAGECKCEDCCVICYRDRRHLAVVATQCYQDICAEDESQGALFFSCGWDVRERTPDSNLVLKKQCSFSTPQSIPHSERP